MTNEDLKKIEAEAMESFKKYAAKELQYIKAIENMGYTAGEAINFMIFLKLEEISDTLCGDGEFGTIAESLDALADCVGYIPPNYYQKEGCHIFRIGGSVDVD